MNLYTCKLGSAEGKIIEKDFEAHNPEMLRKSLEQQGFFVFGIKKKPLQFLWDKGFARRKVSNKEILSFNQELLVLIKAGLPIIQTLDTILEKADKGNFTEILHAVRQDIKGGAALSDALEKYPKVFPHLYIASIRAGKNRGFAADHTPLYRVPQEIRSVEKKIAYGSIVPCHSRNGCRPGDFSASRICGTDFQSGLC